MSSIPNRSLITGQSPRHGTLPDIQFLNYAKKQSVKADESLDAGLTIQTKEGDLITLTANSFFKLDAFMYNSRGLIQTKSGGEAVTQNQREITLTSGESFSFSVAGNLNEKELVDIENIVKGIDGIISEMSRGNMNDAVNKALSMGQGHYDTVSMYSANISYRRSYTIASRTRVNTINSMPATEIPSGETHNTYPSLTKFLRQSYGSRTNSNNTIDSMDKFAEKMVVQLEKSNKDLLDKAQKAIDKLFKHHLEDVKKNKKISTYNVIENTRKQVENLIDQMTEKIFKNYFTVFPE